VLWPINIGESTIVAVNKGSAMLVNNDIRLPVTDDGVLVPKVWLGDASEVMLRNVNGEITIVPVGPAKAAIKPYSPQDSIWEFGKNPVADGITDGSVNHDKYLYDDPHRLNG
jgi:hypothetical protein